MTCPICGALVKLHPDPPSGERIAFVAYSGKDVDRLNGAWCDDANLFICTRDPSHHFYMGGESANF